MPQCSMCSINQSIRKDHEYPITVLLKIAENSMTALLEILSVLLESINLKLIELRTGKEVRPWPDWPDQLLRPCCVS